MIDITGAKTVQRGESQTDIRRQLEQVPVYTPWITYLLLFLQTIAMAILCSVNGIVAPRLGSQLTVIGM